MITLWVSLIVETGVALTVAAGAVKWVRGLASSATPSENLAADES